MEHLELYPNKEKSRQWVEKQKDGGNQKNNEEMKEELGNETQVGGGEQHNERKAVKFMEHRNKKMGQWKKETTKKGVEQGWIVKENQFKVLEKRQRK